MNFCTKWLGRLLLLGVFVAQAVVFAHYPRINLQSKSYYWLIVLVLPAIAVWIYVIINKEKQLNWQWLVWLVYVIFLLVPMVGFLARRDFTKKLDKDHFFGPNFLKITYCGAPVVALLLLVTANDSQAYQGSVLQLCGSIALDLFDELELLEMLIAQDDQVHFSTSIENSIIAFVCISFFLTALEMAENKFGGGYSEEMEVRGKAMYIWRLTSQIFLVNTPLLVIRLVAWKKYHIDASVFVVKNVLLIIITLMESMRICHGAEP